MELPLDIDAQPLLRSKQGGGDPELEAVAAELRAADPDGNRFARTLRRSIDMLLDGRNTGRYRWDQLHKTEKTYAGTLVEINLQREFGFADGSEMDYRIAGADVDCKFSQRLGGWMIPPEAVGHLCLLVWCDDERSLWSAGLVRITEEALNQGSNRDRKRSLGARGKAAVMWLEPAGRLPENVLLRMPEADVQAVFAKPSGQARLDELFRRAQRRRVTRSVVATVAQQDDYMKRIRYNGGSRSRLAPEGIVILGQYGSHVRVAQRLGLPVPQAGESVSARLAPATAPGNGTPCAEIDGGLWRVARPDDPVVPAPRLPER